MFHSISWLSDIPLIEMKRGIDDLNARAKAFACRLYRSPSSFVLRGEITALSLFRRPAPPSFIGLENELLGLVADSEHTVLRSQLSATKPNRSKCCAHCQPLNLSPQYQGLFIQPPST